MIDFEFLVRENCEDTVSSDVNLFFVMTGSCEVTVEDKKYKLKKDDFMVINVDQHYSYSATTGFIGSRLAISYIELSKLLKQNMIFFWCNTAVENSDICDELRIIIKKINSEQYKNKSNIIYLNSLYYELLHILTNDFLLNKNDKEYKLHEHKFDARKHEIDDYIRMNYDKQISLNDLAGKLFLSNAYLSKYIKRQFGMSFVEYVNSVRLSYAVSQLLYSDKSVLKIAMDTGFASSAALNKAFKDKYGVTPTVYRSQWAGRDSGTNRQLEEDKQIQQKIAEFFKTDKPEEKTTKKVPVEEIYISKAERKPFSKPWQKMISIGAASDLLLSDMQRHVLYLRDKLHFTYVRFWDIYSPEMFLNLDAEELDYNFDKLDRVIDFLMINNLKPFIELRMKPKFISVNQGKVIEITSVDETLDTEERIRPFIHALIVHLINRYHADQVETWFFEVWKTELDKYVHHANIADADDSIGLYLDRFEIVAEELRRVLPEVSIGGGGFALRYGKEHLKKMLLAWKDRKELPNFISVYNYPYTAEYIEKERNQCTDLDFTVSHLTQIKDLMAEVKFPKVPLKVTEWNFSPFNRNVLNDHCMKGAYMVKSMMDSIGLVDTFGYWGGSDIYSDYKDSKKLLNGGGGLVCKVGIPKPAFYAFDFMNKLGRSLIDRGSHYIITDNGSGNYRIVCNNLKQLNYQYGTMREDEVILQE
ncbi:MAG: helix-turn-helix domain-containing protein, partial [Pseudobutyrivibrio sp.]|nr:helix-turn-helix domain-containing protein [Pseudobutyrivibrio sp.]